MERKEEQALFRAADAWSEKIPPGRYRHYKGGEYEVISVACHSETLEAVVVYRALYGEGRVWVRPACMWCEDVGGVPRFQKISNAEDK